MFEDQIEFIKSTIINSDDADVDTEKLQPTSESLFI